MSGPRNPYQEGALGVIEEGAYADLILVDGNPLENLDLVADPDKNFVVIIRITSYNVCYTKLLRCRRRWLNSKPR